MKKILSTNILDILKDKLNVHQDTLFTGDYIGVVENNNDPLRIGRCKIRIHGLHEDIPTEDLQWATPEFPLSVGKKGSFIVPEIGTVVKIKFDIGDRYEPMYSSKVLDTDNLNFECNKDEDYPNSVIFYETQNGDYFKINRAKGELVIKTGSGVINRISEDGTYEIDNTSSEKGDYNLKIRGDITVDNKLANTKISTGDYQLDLFGDLYITSNNGSEQKYLEDYTIKTNKDINLISSNEINIKSKNILKTESIEQNIVTNKLKISPATSELTTTNVDGSVDTVPSSFSYEFPSIEEVANMTVTPSILGGPFNAIPFDPLTGMPHQGRIVTGNPILKTNISNILEVNKEIKRIKDKYSKLIKKETDDIIKKYSSIDSQAQLLLAGPGNSSLLLEKKATEIKEILDNYTAQMTKEIEEVNSTLISFFSKPIYGTINSGEAGEKETYINKIPQATIDSKLDMTGKTTYKDIIGAGKGLVDDD